LKIDKTVKIMNVRKSRRAGPIKPADGAGKKVACVDDPSDRRGPALDSWLKKFR